MISNIDLNDIYFSLDYRFIENGNITCKKRKDKPLWWLKIKYFFDYKLLYKFKTITLYRAIKILSKYLISKIEDRTLHALDFLSPLDVKELDIYSLEMIKDWFYNDHFNKMNFKIYGTKCFHNKGVIIEKKGPVICQGDMNNYLRTYNKILENDEISYVDLRVDYSKFKKLMLNLVKEE
jgi:hypothetical protein